MKYIWFFLRKIFDSKAFGFLAVLFLVGTVLLLLGRLAGGEWLDLMKWLGGFGAARSMAGDIKPLIRKKEVEIEKDIASDSDSQLVDRIIDRTK